ncbi:probable WRKY transcription factor 19 [Phtheirospermum japonicum]|uniref:Probable WRKY transcription factor 19 n=1 Tax=Phtheirospermum japonicum TaxID=374723 RepID=A0A830BI80_9LAMI|nr:probable WRKY transcription factor 19 [Phtheirospermum japonicum]
MYSAFFGDFVKNSNVGDTTLRLDGFGYGSRKTSSFGNSQTNNGPDDGCKLVLGLGPTPSSYSDEYYFPSGVDKGISSQRDSILKLGPSGGADAGPNMIGFLANRNEIPVVDEGSTSAKKSGGGYMTGLILAPRIQISQPSSEPSAISNYSISTVSEPGSATVSSSSDRRSSSIKKCNFPGCTKGARGATGLCIGHGGGQRCHKPGCNKGAESRTAFCKSHGGGRRCQHLGCTKSAEGKTDHCIAHGGGRRCGHPGGCTKAARGRSGLCIRHGGGKRCAVEGCARSAEGQIGLCISHGGGRRCQIPGCGKGAQGSTVFCKAHGGGKRCVFAGCTKGAEGSTPLCKGHGGGKRCTFGGGGMCPKSVHGGTSFCVAHGGGKRCAVPGCTKSARGRTDCCVRHGGGKRCRFESCGKSAQGSTDFCKAHGGGKRCGWSGEGKCEKFARGKSGLCAAHASLAQGRETTGRGEGGMIGPGLFRGLVVRADSTARSGFENTCSSSGMSAVSDSTDSLKRPVLVPLSMKVSSFYAKLPSPERPAEIGRKRLDFAVPEGRVHGGGLLTLLGGNLNNAIDGI